MELQTNPKQVTKLKINTNNNNKTYWLFWSKRNKIQLYYFIVLLMMLHSAILSLTHEIFNWKMGRSTSIYNVDITKWIISALKSSVDVSISFTYYLSLKQSNWNGFFIWYVIENFNKLKIFLLKKVQVSWASRLRIRVKAQSVFR